MHRLALAAALSPLAPLAPLAPITPVSPVVPTAPALPAISLAAPGQPAAVPSPEKQAAQSANVFDGSAWKQGSFESAAGGAVAYKARGGGEASPTVFAGGLALNESFEPLFASQAAPKGGQLFLWTRGHPPTPWTAAKNPLDADARDLARAIVLAGRASPTGKVELALHSFGTIVFQRMVQLRGDPEVDAALEHLADSRVTLLNATTRYEGSEKKAGPEFERMGQATRGFVDWLDAMDASAQMLRATANLNPFLAPQIAAVLETWAFQRTQALILASRDAAAMMKKDLQAPWQPAFEAIRKAFLKALERDAQDPGWQEAMVRRSADMFRLEFEKGDARHIRRLRIKIQAVHSSKDQLLNWASAHALFERLGIEAPEQAPPPGAILKDRTGLFTAEIVDADHYYPLKRPDLLLEVLDR